MNELNTLDSSLFANLLLIFTFPIDMLDEAEGSGELMAFSESFQGVELGRVIVVLLFDLKLAIALPVSEDGVGIFTVDFSFGLRYKSNTYRISKLMIS